MRIGLLAAVVGAAGLAGCECLEAKSGIVNVDTDCAGATITHASIPFVQAPGGIGQQQIQELFPEQLKGLAGELACEELLNPQSFSDLCAPLGVGGGLEPLELGNATDTRVLMCGGQMFAIGGFASGIFICKADQAVIDGQIWFMECQHFTLDSTSPTGTCQGVVEFDQVIGT